MNYLQRKKQAMISMHQGSIPSGYKQVEYLESTGTQFIKTNYIPTINTVIKCDYIMRTQDLQYQEFIGSRSADNAKDTFAIRQFVSFDNLNYQRSSGGTSTRVNMEKNIKYELYTTPERVVLNGIQSQIELITSNGIYPLNLFASNLAGKAWRLSHCRLGNIYLSENTFNDIPTYIPCLDFNNRPCMYDLVSKTPFYNKGTGEFLYGEVIN